MGRGCVGSSLSMRTVRTRIISRVMLVLLVIAVVGGIAVVERQGVFASTIGNITVFNDRWNDNAPSYVDSGWWGGGAYISQRYGCTSYPYEDLNAGIAHGCPAGNQRWDSGIDVEVGGTMKSQVVATVVESVSGLIGLLTDG